MKMSIPLAVFAAVFTAVGGMSGCASTSDTRQESTQAGPSVDGPSTESSAVAGATGSERPTKAGTLSDDTAATRDVRPDVKRSVYYEFDRFEVKPEYRPLVERHASWLRANPQARVTVEGNADERGSREYNLSLGQRRAESVTRLMVMLGVKSEQIEAVSFGKEKPRADGHDEASWAENRRSDLADR